MIETKRKWNVKAKAVQIITDETGRLDDRGLIPGRGKGFLLQPLWPIKL
jgi:hypothetical protein